MPASQVTDSVESTPPSPKKQRNGSSDDSIFPYPYLPTACVMGQDEYIRPPEYRDQLPALKPVWSEYFHIEIESSADPASGTDSAEWGDDQTAAKRACFEPKVTDSNKELFRTHHPSLSQQTDVYWREESFGRYIWLVEVDGHYVGTHAGGIGIHLIPRGFLEKQKPGLYPCDWLENHQRDPVPESLDPRKFLAPPYLNMLREMCPTSIGARVFVSGYIVLLFKDCAAIKRSWEQDGKIPVFGNLRVCYDVLENLPTNQKICSGAPVSHESDPSTAVASLGLKLRLPQGYEAITVPTHAFVALRPVNWTLFLRISSWYNAIKTKLSRLTRIHRPAIGHTHDTLDRYSPLGRAVTLAHDLRQIGTITKSYDPIADEPLCYPIGFSHDISLVTNPRAKGLPEMEAPSRTACVVGWGSYEDVQAEEPIFMTALNVQNGNSIHRAGHGVSATDNKVALHEGAQHLWENQNLTQNISILWRTEREHDSLEGFSGSVLCLGKREDKTCLAVCFQNFQFPMISKKKLLTEHRPASVVDDMREYALIRGGFLLPEEIRTSEILCHPSATSQTASTFPAKSDRQGILRRSLSSPDIKSKV
ncbi:unnamed protein product [Penicillium olsonii]|uniref:Uncharacterized protein n=1 Tax=Penicillium olsonii TaxID=99116 RepID=A0A9W4I1U3_PENOL|nr:unnamed protein product [Penicillium olsonii]CAG8198535.1 unnamed protein product [Penicillium olsonii]